MGNKIIRDIEVMSVKDFMQGNYHYPVKSSVFFGILSVLSGTVLYLYNQTDSVIDAFLYIRPSYPSRKNEFQSTSSKGKRNKSRCQRKIQKEKAIWQEYCESCAKFVFKHTESKTAI